MSDNLVLFLGPIAFGDFETPSNINFGGGQRLAVHRLPGGGRVIDAMGRDDAEMSWSGIFTGDDAVLRARALDSLRSAGQPLPLTWDSFFYTVILARFDADYTRSNWIPYRITCTVLRDEAAEALESLTALVRGAAEDVAEAALFTTGVDFTDVADAFGRPDAMTRGSAAYAAAGNALATTSQVIAAGVFNFGAVLTGTSLASAGALVTATEQAGTLAGLTAAYGFVRRAACTVQEAGN